MGSHTLVTYRLPKFHSANVGQKPTTNPTPSGMKTHNQPSPKLDKNPQPTQPQVGWKPTTNPTPSWIKTRNQPNPKLDKKKPATNPTPSWIKPRNQPNPNTLAVQSSPTKHLLLMIINKNIPHWQFPVRELLYNQNIGYCINTRLRTSSVESWLAYFIDINIYHSWNHTTLVNACWQVGLIVIRFLIERKSDHIGEVIIQLQVVLHQCGIIQLLEHCGHT